MELIEALESLIVQEGVPLEPAGKDLLCKNVP